MFDWIRRGLKRAQPAVDPFEQFVVDFATECKRQNFMPESYDPQARAFVFGRADGGAFRFQLGNMFRHWREQDEAGRAELITGSCIRSSRHARATTSRPRSFPAS
jgi:hypothetical protein